MNKNKNIPRLRFPEFSGDWLKQNKKPEIISGLAYELSEYCEKGTPLIQGLNIYNGFFDTANLKYVDSTQTKLQHIVVRNGDILLGLNRPITNNELKVCKFPLELGYLYQRAGILKLPHGLNRDYFYHLLCSDNFLKFLSKELVGSDQPYIKSNLFVRYEIYVPTLSEQEKIAECLSSVDELITGQVDRIATLKEHKKGLMQKLFPQ